MCIRTILGYLEPYRDLSRRARNAPSLSLSHIDSMARGIFLLNLHSYKAYLLGFWQLQLVISAVAPMLATMPLLYLLILDLKLLCSLFFMSSRLVIGYHHDAQNLKCRPTCILIITMYNDRLQICILWRTTHFACLLIYWMSCRVIGVLTCMSINKYLNKSVTHSRPGPTGDSVWLATMPSHLLPFAITHWLHTTEKWLLINCCRVNV